MLRNSIFPLPNRLDILLWNKTYSIQMVFLDSSYGISVIQEVADGKKTYL